MKVWTKLNSDEVEVRELKYILERAVFTLQGSMLETSLVLEKQGVAEGRMLVPRLDGYDLKTLDECEKRSSARPLRSLKATSPRPRRRLPFPFPRSQRKIRECNIK